TLLQRDRVLGDARGRVAQVPLPWAGEDHSVRDRHPGVREVHGADRGRGDLAAMTRALAVIAGEHYPPVVRDALATLPYCPTGPAEPHLAAVRPTLASLLDLSRAGHHAASDYLETAALTGVVTIGCRRAGGGLAGGVTMSNVLQGAALAAEREPDVVVFDGSGAAIPPIDVDARILVSGRGHDPLGYLNAYRVLVSDLVVMVGGGDEGAVRALKELPVVQAELRLRPVVPLEGRRV